MLIFKMPSTINRCCLCLSSLTEFQSLLDDSGQLNESYNMAVKYFDPMFLQSGPEYPSPVICIECWEIIKDFHTFQEWIIKTQLQLRNRSSSGDQIPQEVFKFNNKETVFENTIQKDVTMQIPTSDNSYNCPDIVKSEFTISDLNEPKIKQSGQAVDMHSNLFSDISYNCPDIATSKFTISDLNEPKIKQSDQAVDMHSNLFSDISYNCPDIAISEFTISDLNEPKIKQSDQAVDMHSNLFSCNVCGECFKSAKTLYYHKNKMHVDTRNICSCKKSKELYAKNETDLYKVICCPLKKKMLKNDSFIAKWKGILECGLCKATFSYYSLLRVHFKYDHPKDKFFIECCERKLYQLGITLEHIRLHLDPFAFKCKICHLCYSAKSCLNNHMKNVHNKAKQK